MRFGLSSSSASEASGDEDVLGPLKDLRTPAGRAGLAPSSSFSLTAARTHMKSRRSSTGTNLRTSEHQASPSSSHAGPSSSSRRLLEDSGRRSLSQSVAQPPAAPKTVLLPPWIRRSRSKATDGDDKGPSRQGLIRHSDSTSGRVGAGGPTFDERDHDDESDDRGSDFEIDHTHGSSRVRRRTPADHQAMSGSRTARRDHRRSPPSSVSSDHSLSSSQGDDDSDTDSAPRELDTSSSDELNWSIAAGQTVRKRSKTPRSSTRRATSSKEQEILQSIRVAGEEDDWDGEWGDVVRRSSSRWREIVSRPGQDQSRATSILSPVAKPADQIDFAEVEQTLSRLRLEKEDSERKDRADFEAREKKLWASIEDAIRAAETEARQRAQEEADRLASARRAQEEAEKRAKAAREDEERKIKEEQAQRERAKAEQEQERKLAEEEERKLAEAEKLKEATAGMGGGDVLRVQAREEYTAWRDKMKHIKEQVLPVVASNTQWRKQCFAAKRQITPKIGQLTNSRQEIVRITTALSALLNEAKGAPCPKQEIYTWILNHLAKCLIRQAEQEVAVKFDTAYPLARVVVWLLLDGHAELGEVLMARLVKKSCWCLGYVPAKVAGQDDADYAKAVGRASPDETSVQFASRQAGILAFYFAICQTPPTSMGSSGSGFGGGSPVDVSLIPPHMRPRALWTWQARCITPPMTRHAIVPSLWAALMEVAGDRVLTVYGRQMVKVWTLLYQQGIMGARAEFVKLEEGKAASGRLQLLLEDWKSRGGKAAILKGREMEA
ncbi:unnamed protein product [Parajaminaea phylloscopi]